MADDLFSICRTPQCLPTIVVTADTMEERLSSPAASGCGQDTDVANASQMCVYLDD